MKQILNNILKKCDDRFDLSIQLINRFKPLTIAEIGVFKGKYAGEILKSCSHVRNYIMIDPWRKLENWNKPANKDDQTFERIYLEALESTKFAKDKIQIFRGKTKEVINQIDDNSLDFVYIDGDHTLKGITIDLINIWSKMKDEGLIVGDDFCSSIWQHSRNYEPTLVFPYAVYFAEAMDVKIFGLPYNQFLIAKGEKKYDFIDLTNNQFENLDILSHF